jgi:hypothetical protein
MKPDYFSDLLSDNVTRITQLENKRVTSRAGEISNINNKMHNTLRVSRMSRLNCSDTEQDEAIAEHLAERAGIREYDGGMGRQTAEAESQRNLRVYRYQLTDYPERELVLIAPGANLTEATDGLQARFGKRLLKVREWNYKPDRDGKA